ncbi:MAG: hypothetical protein HeimC3_28890 [Candidatus Heimdallarchaeota archaeon LC_3]|nr:MAG: hypothetical protein HeimC3_28890 [Candidatus Heimdallarchaeota archaeon LC_3]
MINIQVKIGVRSLIKAIESFLSEQVEAEFEGKTYSGLFPLVMVGFSLLLGFYLLAHQMGSTGFFTTAFNTLEMLLLYGSLIFWIVTNILQLLLGRRNLLTLFELFGGLIFIFSIVWLFVTFPFDFTYFADVAPDFLRFLVQWIDNNIARVLMVLLIVLSLIMEVWSATLHVFYRKALVKKLIA